MTDEAQTSQVQDQKISDKELNFRNLEAKYQKELAAERQARFEAEKERQRLEQEMAAKKQHIEDDDDDSEPYVDKKKLQKQLAKFGEQTQKQTQTDIQRAVFTALQEERKNTWLKDNKDFYDVLQHAEKLAQKDPDLAETILEMPEGFERQKLVYKNIKALGLHKELEKGPSIQEKIDANRRSPYYQPSGVGSAPYAGAGDFSPVGQKNAYAKLQELKGRLRLS
jgi:hypothetical protein